jgi:hypothetical protein
VSWMCSKCGVLHDSVPDSYAFNAPWPWYLTSDKTRNATSFLSENECVLERQDYFVAGCLEIPVIGREAPFIWGVWVSLSKDNFDRQRLLRTDPARVHEPSYFGWLSSRIQVYPDTILLKTHVHSRPVGMKPYIELEPTGHPLAVDQRNGISLERVQQIAEAMQHKWLHPEWDKKGFYGGAS